MYHTITLRVGSCVFVKLIFLSLFNRSFLIKTTPKQQIRQTQTSDVVVVAYLCEGQIRDCSVESVLEHFLIDRQKKDFLFWSDFLDM